MGQSNMAGRGEYADATERPIGVGYEFRSVSNDIHSVYQNLLARVKTTIL